MKSKPFYLSKTFWSLVITFAITVWNGFVVQNYNLPPVPEWLLSILAMFGLYARWTASGPLTLKREMLPLPENTAETATKQIVTDDFSDVTELAEQVKEVMTSAVDTNKLENKSYYLTHKLGTESDFLKLPESEQILDPEVFRKKYTPAPITSVSTKSTANTPSPNVKPEEAAQKNKLLNKIYFLLEKCGTRKDFEALPDDVKNLPKDLFKEKTKNICPEKK